jgi:hypothetical protein
MASLDGRIQQFWECKSDGALEEAMGHYEGYICDAGSLIQRIETRGGVVFHPRFSKQRDLQSVHDLADVIVESARSCDVPYLITRDAAKHIAAAILSAGFKP